MTYDEIYKPLSRTSFASKMKYAFFASVETMDSNGQVESKKLKTIFLPDEIETFVLNSVVAKEYSIQEMSDNQFINVMNAIRSYQPPEFYKRINTDYLRWILPTMGAVQFESQQYSLFRLYRHHCLFSYSNESVDIDKAFKKKFERAYDEYAAVVITVQILLGQKKLYYNKDYLERLRIKAPWFFNNLKLTRDQYKKELSDFAKSKKDYRYCLRPSYSFPFIEYKGTIYLPTPHLLIQSITTAMMNRLTFGNDQIREKIGKNACEDYIFRIVLDSGIFDEVKREYEYEKGKRTLDVLTRRGNVSLLIDSKLFSPKVSLRTYDEEAYEKDKARIVKTMKQAYLHAHDRFNHDYNPFTADVNNVYALVVVYQEGYIDLGEIYDRTAQILSIDKDSVDYDWLWHHIGFTDFASFERFMLTKTDIISVINAGLKANQWFTRENSSEPTDEVSEYNKKLMCDAEIFLRELYG